MKKFAKLVCLSVFVGILVCSWTFHSEASKNISSETNLINNLSAESSQKIYSNNCARCHGADGKGQTELGKLNDTPDISGGRARSMGSKRVIRIITNGDGSMPAFGKKLTKAQIASVANYVRGL